MRTQQLDSNNFFRQNRLIKFSACLVLITFLTSQISWAADYQPVLQQPYQPTKSIQESQVSAKSKDQPVTSDQFLADDFVIRRPEAVQDDVKINYEYERYRFEDALELFRPEFASAVILKEPLSKDDLKSLYEHSVKEGIEIAVLILHGETVLISSGNEDEITASPAGREILKEASFSLHTHPDKHLIEGPSLADLLAAGGTTHYVLTTRQAYSYTEEGVIGTGDIGWLIEKYTEAYQSTQEARDEIKVREELNQLIAEQDRMNLLEEEKETWVAGSTGLSYTSSLTAANITTLPGSPYPYLMAGSSAVTALAYASDQFTLSYDATASGSYSAMTISFDDASTSTVETRDISGLASLIFGVKGKSAKLHVDFVDVNGNKDRFTLKSISTTERFWKILTSSIVSSVNKTKIKEIRFIVDQTTTSSSTRTGTEVIRIKGLNVNAPMEPVVTSEIPEATGQSTFTLTGTKEAHTAIVINGSEVIAKNDSTAWSYTVNLNTEGNNSFDIQTKNTIGKLSSLKSVTLVKDSVAPTGSIRINSDAVYATSPDVVLTLTGTDATSGLDQMRFSVDGGATFTNWEVFAETKSLTLPGEDGTKEVLMEIRDRAGNTAQFRDTIRLHTTSKSYYVSKTTGSDTQQGSETNPWQSIQHGVSQLLPGDTLYIQEGVYEESVSLASSGLAEALITIQGMGNAILDGQNLADSLDGFNTQGHDYLVFKNLTLNNLNAGIDVNSASQFIEIDGLKADGNHYAIRIQDSSNVTVKNAYAINSKNAFRMGGTSQDILLEKVEAYNSLDIFPGSNPDYLNGDGVITEAQVNRLTIRNSIFANNADAGIDFKGTNGLFENVVVYGNKNNFKMWGTATIRSSLSRHAKRQLRSDGSTVEGNGITVEAGQTKMVNVTFVDNEDHDIHVYAGGTLSVENSIVARKILDPTGMLLESAGTFTSQNVLWYARGVDPTHFTFSPTDLWDDPQFMDWRAGDYRLWYASPAVDRGDAAFERSDSDLELGTRMVGAGIDLGAYENQWIAQKPLPFQEFGGSLVIEAEHPYAKLAGIAQDWLFEQAITGYSGDGYFFADPDSNSTYNDPSQYLVKSPELRYEIQIENTGTYYVWVRAYAAEGKSDSVHVGLDGLASDTADRMYFKDKSVFSWSNKTMDLDTEGRSLRATIDITATGNHFLNVWMREDGLRFDKIILTQDPNFMPLDFGPEESWRVDTVPPQGQLEIPAQKSFVSSHEVSVFLHETDESSGIGAVRFSEDGLVWRDWETYRGGPKTVTLTGANGVRKLYAQLRDRAGNVGEVLAEEFILYVLPSDGSLVSLKTEEGFILNYLANEIFSVEKPSEYTLIAPEIDSSQALTGGVVLYAAGSGAVPAGGGATYYTSGKVVWNQTPQGDKYSYDTQGRLTEILSANKKKTTFSYQLDLNGNIQQITAQNESGTSLYDPQGKLLQIQHSAGDKIFYDHGILQSAQLSSGAIVSYQKVILSTGVRMVLNSQAPDAYPASIEYDSQGEILKIVRQTGEQILFSQGVPSKSVDKDGVESNYNFESDSVADFTGLTLNRLDYLSHFDANGNLFAIDLPTTPGVVINSQSQTQVKRFEISDGKISNVILTDGTAVEIAPGGYDLNSNQIKTGTLRFSDGSQIRYQDGTLVEIVTKEGASYQVTVQGTNYIATRQGTASDSAAQFILDQDLNVTQLTQTKDIVKLLNDKIDQITPNCQAGTPGCEEARFFYYLSDKSVVIQGNFTSRPSLESLASSQITYSMSTFDLQGQPVLIKTFDTDKLTRMDFSYGKIRHVFSCHRDETSCTETFQYNYEFDSAGNETAAVTELSTGTLRRYRNDLLREVVTTDNVVTSYAYDSQDRLLSSQMNWQGRILESFTYAYDEANKKSKITDKEGVTRVYDQANTLIGIIQGNEEFAIYHFTQNGEARQAQELVKKKDESGLVFHYQMGKITAVEYPDGKILQDIIEDETGGIFSARIVYPDGTHERIVQGEDVEIRRPDGSVWNYMNGRLVKMQSPTGRSFAYLYTSTYIRVYEAAVNSAYRYNLQGQYLQTDSGTGTPLASLEPLTLSLATISYSDLATTSTKTSTDQSSDFFKAKIISSENGQITLKTLQQDQLLYQAGKLVKEIEAGTDHAKEYSYDGTNTILSESGSVQSFDSEKKLFRFIDYLGNSYEVTPVLNENEITAYSLVSSASTVWLDAHGQIQSVTGASVTQSQFLNIHFDLSNTPLNISQIQIQGSAEVTKGGDFSMKIKLGANPQAITPPQIYVSSPVMFDSSSYTLVYTVDGVQKTKAVTLQEGKNLLDVTEQDASGNKTTVQFAVTYAPPVPFEEQNGLVVIEAEHPQADYQKGGNFWEFEASQDGKSGDGYFVAGPDAAKVRDTDYVQNAPELQYKIQIQNPGTYYVWIRGYAPDGGSDSINVGLDGQAIDTSDRINFWPAGKWLWTNQTQDKDAAGKPLKAVITVSSAGIHTLNVWMREDGLIFDKILLTKDPNFVPKDLGPNESYRNYTPPQTNPQGELLDLVALVQDYQSAQMGANTVVYSVFDKDGKLVDTQKVDGTITQYSQGKIAAVWDRSGRLLQSYVYDSDGNPVKITLNQMRAEFPVKIQQAKEEVEKQKNEALRGLATQQQTAVQQIQTAFAADRLKLQKQRQNLEGQRYQTVCQTTFCFESCQTVENPGVAQAINQIDQSLSNMNQQEAQAYANLQTEIEQARVKIDTQVGIAFQTIGEQEQKFRNEIIRQEISPVIFNYYRTILGRDPNEDEYNRWITETDFNQGLDIVRLRQVLSGKTASGQTITTEYSAELAARVASVTQIKASVTQFMNDYKVKSQTEKIQITQQFGLSATDLTFFTSAEADKVLSWLNTRSLHFGQSAFIALEQMLQQAGIAYTREDLAKKLILVDMLTGVINPFDEGELVLSLFSLKQVAKLYGLQTEGVNLDFEDLAVFYQTHSGQKMIAHINGDHYVIVTAIKNIFDTEKQVWVRKVVYTDPGAGPDGHNQVMEITEQEFLKAWQGNVLMTQTTSSIILQQHEADPNLKANPPPHVLAKPELQAVRGSFFFFLIPFFAFVFSAVAAVATAVVAVITTVVAAIGAVLGPIIGAIQGALLGIISGLESLAGAFLGFATSMLNAIPFIGPTLSGVVGAIGNFALGFVSGFLTGFVSTALTGTFSNFIVTAATTFLLSPGGIESVLTTIGVPEKVAHYIGMGISIVGSIATGNPFLIASTLTSIAVTEIGPRIGLSPQLTAALSIASSALSGTIAQGYFDPNTTVFQALKNAAPKLVSSFAQAGIVGLGDAIGLDPRLTSLLSIGAGSVVSGLTQGLLNANGGGGPGSVLNAIKNSLFSNQTLGGLVSVGASMGLAAIGAPSLLQNFIPGLLNGLIASGGSGGSGSSVGDDIFKRITDNITKFGKGIFSVGQQIISFGAKVIEGIGSVTKAGFAKAVDYFSSIFDRQTQEVLIKAGNGSVEQAILNNLTITDGTATVNIDGVKIVWDSAADKIIYDNLIGISASFSKSVFDKVTGALGFENFAYAENTANGSKINLTSKGTYIEAAVNVDNNRRVIFQSLGARDLVSRTLGPFVKPSVVFENTATENQYQIKLDAQNGGLVEVTAPWEYVQTIKDFFIEGPFKTIIQDYLQDRSEDLLKKIFDKLDEILRKKS